MPVGTSPVIASSVAAVLGRVVRTLTAVAQSVVIRSRSWCRRGRRRRRDLAVVGVCRQVPAVVWRAV
jgi:hypothetical protein